MPNLKYHKVNQTGEEGSSSSNNSSTENMDNPAFSTKPSGMSRESTSEDLGAIIGPTNFPSTHSSQQLMPSDSDSICEDPRNTTEERTEEGSFGTVKYKEWMCVITLCFINLINYMDRFTIAGESMIIKIKLLLSSGVIISSKNSRPQILHGKNAFLCDTPQKSQKKRKFLFSLSIL
jgi:hypothetical protein